MSFSTGGGGSSKIGTSGDVALSNPTDDDVLSYDSATQKWKNVATVKDLQQSTPVNFATLQDAQTAGANGQLAVGQLVVIG